MFFIIIIGVLIIIILGMFLYLLDKENINEDNSSLTVRCTNTDRCFMRHTDVCDYCKKNVGVKYKNYFEPKDF